MTSNMVMSLAIQIGETHSGCVYGLSHHFKTSRPDLVLYYSSPETSLKPSTALLLNSDKSFNSFGNDADRNYAEMAEKEGEDQTSYYYFRNLHNVKLFNKSAKLKDETGKMIPLFDVFVHLIRFFVGDFAAKSAGACTPDACIHVLSIPVRWGYAAKQLVREAAEQAGIPRDTLMVVLEPVVAAFCLHMDTNIDNKSFYEASKTGAEYLVLDLGGRTADISCHQQGGFLRQLLPKGIAPGGDTVTEEYMKFLGQIFGEKYLLRLKEEHTDEYFDILHNFEKKICILLSKNDKSITFDTNSLLYAFDREKDDVDVSRFDGSVTITSNCRLRISIGQCRLLFLKYITAIETSIERITQDVRFKDVEYILMIGEFSKCQHVTTTIRNKFPQKRIIVPKDADLAVLKGAVYYGFLSEENNQEKVRYTYGIQHWPEFDKYKHPLEKLVVIDGVTRCKDVFFKYIEKDQDIPENRRVSCAWTPFSNHNTDNIDCTVYVSSQNDPKFTDDDGCAVLGVLHTSFTADKGKEALKIEQTLIFGRTCITLQAENMATGQICETQIEYM